MDHILHDLGLYKLDWPLFVATLFALTCYTNTCEPTLFLPFKNCLYKTSHATLNVTHTYTYYTTKNNNEEERLEDKQIAKCTTSQVNLGSKAWTLLNLGGT